MNAPAQAVRAQPGCFHVLGVEVNAVQIPDTIATLERWIAERRPGRYVVVANVHVIMEAKAQASFARVLAEAALVAPDGMPLVWIGRGRGFPLPRRCYGPELMLEFLRATAGRRYRHFFYGGAPGVAEELARRLTARFPGLEVAGTYSPPFRPLTPEEDAEVVERINRARAQVLWVGLGCPKQEIWMHEHGGRLNVAVALGVGQAFDIHTGRARQAPAWAREHGWEWAFRLVWEPRRLWRRYLVYNTKFLWCVLAERVRRKRFDAART